MTSIYLDPDDVLGSIKAKIDLAGEHRLTLIVPLGLRALYSPVNLRLLRRYLEGLGLQATLVSRDERVGHLARAEGLRVRAVEQPARGRSRARGAAVLAVAGMTLAVALPLAAAAVFLPSATVILYPEVAPFDDVVQVRASTMASRSDPAGLVIPGEALQVDFEVKETMDISRSAVLATRAQGSMTLSNRSTALLELKPGAKVGTGDGRVYILQTPLTILPGQEESVAVAAEQAGAEGNAPSGALDRLVEPAFAGLLRVTNPQPLQGGRDRVEARVSESHHRQLRERAVRSAREDALRRLQQQRPSGSSFYDDALVLKVAAEELEPRLGSIAKEVSLALSGSARVIAFQGDDVNGILRRHEARKEEAQQLLEAPFAVAPLELVRADPDEITFQIRVQGARGPRVEEERVKELVRGKPAREAEEALAAQFRLVGRPRVETAPFWAPGVSVFPWRISVQRGGGP